MNHQTQNSNSIFLNSVYELINIHLNYLLKRQLIKLCLMQLIKTTQTDHFERGMLRPILLQLCNSTFQSVYHISTFHHFLYVWVVVKVVALVLGRTAGRQQLLRKRFKISSWSRIYPQDSRSRLKYCDSNQSIISSIL